MRDTIEMAFEAGLHLATDVNWMPIIGLSHLKAFEALVRADEREARSMRWDELIAKAVEAEREACAKVCEDGVQNANDWDSSYWDQACENRAAAIRARGQA
jgi:hypothetical protein